jgi:DNA-binding GntR family transcriptional regulator
MMTHGDLALATDAPAPLDDGDHSMALREQLRTAILRGELPAGVPLSQVELAKRLGVSRTPLREALRMLQYEGLIEGEPNRRVRITSLSVPDLDEIYAMRISLETLAIRLTVPQLKPYDLGHMETLLCRMQTFTEQRDYEQWEAPHQAFHRTLVQYAGQRQQRTIALLFDHADRYCRVKEGYGGHAWLDSMEKHREIYDACAAGSPALAAERLARHYSTTVLNLIATLDPEYDPVAVRTAVRIALRSAQGS